MCGISAILSINSVVPPLAISNMNNRIAHRGPDDEGYASIVSQIPHIYSGRRTTMSSKNLHKLQNIQSSLEEHTTLFGHVRLAIRDLSPLGFQPMKSTDNRFIIVFNGEIYNDDSLKRVLISLGRKFNSETDTEVLLQSFEEWGVECFSKLNGMFAFIIHDCQKKHTYIVRDRYGVKPLYIYTADLPNKLYVASEIKQFIDLESWLPQANLHAVQNYLYSGQTDCDETTFFRNVEQVKPGHYLLVSHSENALNVSAHQWYSLSNLHRNNEIKEKYQSPTSTYRKYLNLLKDSVSLRLKSQVPIGTALSGGLDSSTISKISNLLIAKRFKHALFHCRTSGLGLDEIEYAQEVNSSLDDSNLIVANHDFSEFRKDLDKFIYAQDEPVLSPSAFSEWLVYKSAKKNSITVMLDGHGADEVLLGYETALPYVIQNSLRQFKVKEFVSTIMFLSKVRQVSLPSLLRMIVFAFQPHCIKKKLASLRKTKIPLLKSSFTSAKKDHHIAFSNIHDYSLKLVGKYSIPKQLRWCDRNSMNFSIESRNPFLDYRLIEYTLAMPVEYKHRSGVSKLPLRISMQNYLPQSVLGRHVKLGFVSPSEQWIKEHGPDLYRLVSSIDVPMLSTHAYLLLEQYCSSRIDYNPLAWRLIFFMLWYKKFILCQ